MNSRLRSRVEKLEKEAGISEPGDKVEFVLPWPGGEPIKLMVRSVLQAPMSSVFRMELRPATLTEMHWYADGLASLRSFNLQPSLL